MTLNELRYIVAVARERHFGRAAESCFVSQPTLSVAVRKLEDELGLALFERGQGEVTVTPVGEEIVAQAQRVLEEASLIKQIATHGRDQLAGALRLGVLPTVGPALMPLLVSELAKRTPTMPLMIEEGVTELLAEQLRQGDLDAVILCAPFESPGVLVQILYAEPLQVVLPAEHRLAGEAKLTTSHLAGENMLLLAPGHCLREQVLAVCPACVRNTTLGEGVVRVQHAGSIFALQQMVASGLGISLMPLSALTQAGALAPLLAARTLVDAQPVRRVAIAWRRSFPRPQAVEAVWRAIGRLHLPWVVADTEQVA